MARLTAKRRKALPASKFALSGRRYPVDTRVRAANAKARATQAAKRGRLSTAAKRRVHAAANRRLRRP